MKNILKTLCIAGGVLCAVKGLDNRLEITYHDIKSNKIPKEFDRFRIVHISDFHCESLPSLIEEIRNEAPDIIVSTGDMVNDTGAYQPAVRLIERLCAIAPVYMITGNHDLWRSDYKEMEKEMLSAGAVFLHNKRIDIERDGAKISLTGIDDPFTRESNRIYETLEKSLESIPTIDEFDILLFHRANLLDQLKNTGFDLILSGHMHGGQIRLPGFGGVVSPRSGCGSNGSMFFPKYFGGRYENGDTTMIVNRGLGNPMIIPRIFNRPEVGVINLKHTK